MTIDIRQSGDVAQIAPVLRILRGTLQPELFEKRLTDALKNGYHALIAQNGESAQGCLGYHVAQDVFWGKTLYVDDLVVRPEVRGQQIGAALLDAAKALAKTLACDHIRLCSGLSRIDAHRFYENNGFDQVSLQFAYAVPNGDH